VATIAKIEPTMSMKPLLAFFFSTRENWVVVFASRRKNGNVACHLDKERKSSGWESVEGWENTRKENGTRWIFVGILILIMIEDGKGWVNKKKWHMIEYWHWPIALIPCKN
jgi:hypothetical protein